MEIKSVTTNIDGLKIRHLEGGEGDMPLVFLHAFFTNAESFRGLIGFLGDIQPYSGYSALKFSPSLVKKSRRISKLLDRLIPSKLGDFVWNSDNLMAFVINTIDPLQETERGFHERINGLRTARFKTFVHTLGEILSLNIDVKKYLTQKPTILIMSATDDSLIYDVTQRTFQALFPNITEIPINLVQHNPIEPLTTDYFKRNFLYLLSTIDNLTLKARTQMSKP